MMGVRLQRHLGRVESMIAGQYTTQTVHGGVAISCPGCGGISDLPRSHRINVGGSVTPIWSCPWETCPLMEFVELESWQEN